MNSRPSREYNDTYMAQESRNEMILLLLGQVGQKCFEKARDVLFHQICLSFNISVHDFDINTLITWQSSE